MSFLLLYHEKNGITIFIFKDHLVEEKGRKSFVQKSFKGHDVRQASNTHAVWGRGQSKALCSMRLVNPCSQALPGRLLGWIGERGPFLRLLMFWSRWRSRGENHIDSVRNKHKKY